MIITEPNKNMCSKKCVFVLANIQISLMRKSSLYTGTDLDMIQNNSENDVKICTFIVPVIRVRKSVLLTRVRPELACNHNSLKLRSKNAYEFKS